jgi:hypothetical protein
MAMHLVTLYELDGERADSARAGLAKAIGAGVGAPHQGVFDVEVEAETREEALAPVRDGIAAIGADQHFTFPAETGTDFHPVGQRAPDPDEEPDDADEPPHLQGGSPHDDEPAPYDEPPRDVP